MPTPAGNTCPGPAVYHRRRPERTLLYRLVQAHLATWLALHDDGQGRPTPAPNEREFRRYLDCGILAHGFARARCADCGHDFIVAYSCKGRGVCPSCTTRRMAETAAHLVDHVVPRLPVRQWVLSFPKRLRYHLDDAELQNAVLHSFLRCIEQGLRQGRADVQGEDKARIGAVVFIHRFGALLNAHLHFHAVVIDGVFLGEDAETLRFEETHLTPETVQRLQTTIRRRIVGLFVRRGLLERADGEAMCACEHGGGFSLDTRVRIEANDRQGLERLLRYCARPAFAQERLRQIDAEHLVYESPKPGPGGRVSQILTPLELMDRLAALIPPPRRHRHRSRRAGAELAAAAGGHGAGRCGTEAGTGRGGSRSRGKRAPPGGALCLGRLAGAHLRGSSAQLPAMRRHDADHRLHRRPGRGGEDSDAPGRADRAAQTGPGARPAAVGGGATGRCRSVCPIGAGTRIRSAHRVVAEAFRHSGGGCLRLRPARCPTAGVLRASGRKGWRIWSTAGGKRAEILD
jgi:Arc/MetJ family transcription regulator